MNTFTRALRQPAPLIAIPIALYFLALFAVSVAQMPFQTDDFDFLRLVAPLNERWTELFSPYWGWYYRPVFLLYFSVLRGIFGDDPGAFHLASLAIHVINSVLIGWLAWRVAPKVDANISNRSRSIAWISGALFFLWVPHFESFTWVSCASILLVALFSLLTLHLWFSWLHESRPAMRGLLLALACASYAVALGSKEEAASVILPIVALWFVYRKNILQGAFLLPFAALVALHSVLSAEAFAHISLFPRPRVFSISAVLDTWHALLLGWFKDWNTPVDAISLILVLSVIWALATPRKLTLLGVALAMAVPVPLLTGLGAGPTDGRFLYVPAAAMCVFTASLMMGFKESLGTTLRSAKPAEVTALAAAYIALVVRMFTRWGDLFQGDVWQIGGTAFTLVQIGCVGGALLLVKSKRAPLFLLAAVLMPFMVSNLNTITREMPLVNLIGSPFAAILLALAVSRYERPEMQTNWRLVCLIALSAWLWPVVMCPVIVAAYAVSALLGNRQSRDRAVRSLELERPVFRVKAPATREINRI